MTQRIQFQCLPCCDEWLNRPLPQKSRKGNLPSMEKLGKSLIKMARPGGWVANLCGGEMGYYAVGCCGGVCSGLGWCLAETSIESYDTVSHFLTLRRQSFLVDQQEKIASVYGHNLGFPGIFYKSELIQTSSIPSEIF